MTPWRKNDSRGPGGFRGARNLPTGVSDVDLGSEVRGKIDDYYDEYVLIRNYVSGHLSAVDREDVEKRLSTDSRLRALAEPFLALSNLAVEGDASEQFYAGLTLSKFLGWIDRYRRPLNPQWWYRHPLPRRIAGHPWPAMPLDPADFVQFLETESGTDSAVALVDLAFNIVSDTGKPDCWIAEVARGRDRGAISTAVAHFLICEFAEWAMMQLAATHPVLSQLQAQITRIEREHGLEQGEYWHVNEGPPEWQALSEEREAAFQETLREVFLRNGQREIAEAHAAHDERLYKIGKAQIYG